MAREIVVEGSVRRVEDASWAGDDGVRNERLMVHLMGDVDSIKINTPYNASVALLQAVRSLDGHPEQRVRLHVEVRSGNSKEQDPKFVFIEDATARK